MSIDSHRHTAFPLGVTALNDGNTSRDLSQGYTLYQHYILLGKVTVLSSLFKREKGELIKSVQTGTTGFRLGMVVNVCDLST